MNNPLMDLTGAELFVLMDYAVEHGGHEDREAALEELARRGHAAHIASPAEPREPVSAPQV